MYWSGNFVHHNFRCKAIVPDKWIPYVKLQIFEFKCSDLINKYLHQDKTNCDTLIDNHDNTILNEASDSKHLNGDVRSNIDEIDAFLTEKQDEGEGLWMKLKGKIL